VFPNIILGGSKVATNTPRLKFQNVVAIVNCTMKEGGHHEDKSLAYFQVSVADSMDSDIAKYFESVSNFLSEHTQKGKVLIHCQEGASRSPTIFIAHLIHAHKKSYKDALEILHSKYGEEFVSLNSGFVKQILEWEFKILGTKSVLTEKREAKPSQKLDQVSKKRSRSKSQDGLPPPKKPKDLEKGYPEITQ